VDLSQQDAATKGTKSTKGKDRVEKKQRVAKNK
jgi:hypothetical protein